MYSGLSLDLAIEMVYKTLGGVQMARIVAVGAVRTGFGGEKVGGRLVYKRNYNRGAMWAKHGGESAQKLVPDIIPVKPSNVSVMIKRGGNVIKTDLLPVAAKPGPELDFNHLISVRRTNIALIEAGLDPADIKAEEMNKAPTPLPLAPPEPKAVLEPKPKVPKKEAVKAEAKPGEKVCTLCGDPDSQSIYDAQGQCFGCATGKRSTKEFRTKKHKFGAGL